MQLPPFPAEEVPASPTHLRLGWSSPGELVEHPWGLPLLVAGAVGSGKSFLAVQAVEQALALGKGVVVLEMALRGYDYLHLSGRLPLVTDSLFRGGLPQAQEALRRLPPGSLVVVDYWDSLFNPPMPRNQELAAFRSHRLDALQALLLEQVMEGTTLLGVAQRWSIQDPVEAFLKQASGRVLLGSTSPLARELHLDSEVSAEHRKLLSTERSRRGFGLYELAGRQQLLQSCRLARV